MTEKAMYFKQIELGPMENFVYLIGDINSKQAAVVDAAWDADYILNAAKIDGYKINYILLTHGHPDHVNAVKDIVKKTGAVVYLHRLEKLWPGYGGFASLSKENNEYLDMGQLKIIFLHTPGHTAGSQCFLVNNHLFSGDTLFVNACGRTDLPGGSSDQLRKSLLGLRNLDDSVLLYPGHHYGNAMFDTLGEQKKTNPFLQNKK